MHTSIDLADLKSATISQLAQQIQFNWDRPYFGAVPYIRAMSHLRSINDNFGADSGRSIVAYFLANATTWRGPVAKAIKAELNRRLKLKG